MQSSFSLIPSAAAAIHATLSPERMAKYLSQARGNHDLAVRLYYWNCQLCGAFYGPINYAEVAVRNAIAMPLASRFGPAWHRSSKLFGILDARKQAELASAIGKESRQHGAGMTAHHVTSALTFGFWVGLMAASYDRHLWATGTRRSFPHAAAGEDRASIHRKIDRVRQIRNDVMHYRSVFDKAPRRRLAEIEAVIGLICPDTQFFISHNHELELVISQKPS